MKKIQQEELVSKSIVLTIIFIAVMVSTALIQRGYFTPNVCLAMGPLTIVISSIFLLLAIVFVAVGFRKSQKFFEVSAWMAGLATFFMLLNINYGSKALEVKLPSNFFIMPNATIKFYAVSMAVFTIAIVCIWVRTIVKLIKD